MPLLPFGSAPTVNATSTTPGKVQLTGDLTGTATSPALASIVTGATVGSASAIPVITYDNKGRITSTTTATPSGGGGFYAMPFIVKTLEVGVSSTFNSDVIGSANFTNSAKTINQNTNGTANSTSTIYWDWSVVGSNGVDVFHGSTSFAWLGQLITVGTDFDNYIGVGDVAPTGTGMSQMAFRHFGFRRRRTASGSIVLTCTNGNGTAETSTTVTDPGTGSAFMLGALKTNASINYYVNGVLVATHTTNIPGGTFQNNSMQLSLSNTSVATSSTLTTASYTYTQQY